MARTWVFVGSALAVALTAYGYYSYIHDRVGFTPNAGYFSPRYTSAYFNIYLLWFFMAAVVFLGFDGRARDERACIAEVLDSRPVSNVAVLAGRWCAVVLAVVVPLFAGLILIQVVGVVAEATGFEMLAPVESVSVLTFLVVDAIPALVLWCAWVLLLAAALRNRLAVAAVALALLGLQMWALALVPTYLLPALSPTTIHDVWASDLAPRFPELETYVQRLAELLLAVGFLLSAAVVFQRRDGIGLKRRLIVGMVTVVAGVACIITIAVRAQAPPRLARYVARGTPNGRDGVCGSLARRPAGDGRTAPRSGQVAGSGRRLVHAALGTACIDIAFQLESRAPDCVGAAR